jgi:hypothetical protein
MHLKGAVTRKNRARLSNLYLSIAFWVQDWVQSIVLPLQQIAVTTSRKSVWQLDALGGAHRALVNLVSIAGE